MNKNLLAFFTFMIFVMAGCSPAAEVDLSEIPTAIPSVQPPETATPFPTATRIPTQTPTATATAVPTEIVSTVAPLPSPTPVPVIENSPTPRPKYITFATAFSLQNEPITVHQFGHGDVHLILIGGMHGGYEWNTVLLMYEMIDWFALNLDAVPDNLKLSIIPVMNPDGLKLITGSSGRFSRDDVPFNADPGRFNSNGVDLNRNWDCEWSPVAYWRKEEVSAGAAPNSEKEVQDIGFFIRESNPAGVIFYHSAAGSLYPGICNGGQADGTAAITSAYENASGYPQPNSGGVIFSYAVTGAGADYLATQNIASFEVELTNHQDTEFERNLAGVQAVITQITNGN